MTESVVFAELSRNLGDLFDAVNADGAELFGYAEHCVDTVWLGTSTGLRKRHVQPSGRLEMTAKSHARSRSTWWGVATDDFTDIDLDDALATIRRALDWQARRIDVEAGRHDCLLTPSAMGDLMVDLWWSMAARPALEGHSAFSTPGGGTRIGERVADRPIRLQSDPHDPQIGCANWLTTGSSSDMASVFDNGIEIPTT
ncbi:MAG: TldD/PmbA family protein, partial [Candidatus Nanopelagicales bacterium]